MAAAGAPAMRLAITSVAPTILRTGTEEQKQRWLPPILKGEIDFAVAYSESEAAPTWRRFRPAPCSTATSG
jgi:alkylation response protein AidB-like acyl-CoA dehydrogenase